MVLFKIFKVGEKMKKKNVCYVINSIKRCGPVNILISMIKGINLKKFNVSLITLLDDNDKLFLDQLGNLGINIICFDYPKSPRTFIKKTEIVNKINLMNFDVIHVHGHITAMLVDEVKAKKIITVHNKLYEDFKNSYGIISGLIINTFYIHSLKKFDKVICCSKSSFDKCKKKISNVTYIRNGIYIDKNKNNLEIRKKIRRNLNIPDNAIVYIYVGNYTKLKRVLKMLEMFKKNLNNNEYLICLGDGKLFKKAKKYSSEKIIQLGFVKNVIDYMCASDIYTSFSSTEGLPVSIIEALSCNLLLLLSNIDSHKEIIDIDENLYVGEVFNFKDFCVQKEKVANSERNDSILLQEKYLSSKSMMELYEKEY